MNPEQDDKDRFYGRREGEVMKILICEDDPLLVAGQLSQMQLY